MIVLPVGHGPVRRFAGRPGRLVGMGRRRSTANPLAGSLAGVATGALVWSLTEYGVHRWVMHGRRAANPFSAEHLDHHARPWRVEELALDPNLWWKAAGFAVVGAPASLAAGPVFGLAAGGGFAAAYAGYTHHHWRIHHRRPTGPFSRWARRHHLAHHVATPRARFGVTTGIWDGVLGTRRPIGRLRVPRRLAPSWMIGDDGHLAPGLEADYELRGAHPRPVTDADLALARRDEPPTEH